MSPARFAGALVLVVLGGGCVFSAPRYRGPVTPHFDGERFHNQAPTPDHGFRDFLKWSRERERGAWRPYEDVPFGPAPVAKVGRGEVRVTVINHASALIQLDGLNILTDPIWSARCSPVSFAGPHRVRPPGIRFEDLPHIDVVLVSHNHYDHLDLPTLKRLEKAFHPRVLTGLGNRALLVGEGLSNVSELDWWDQVDLGGGVVATLVPAQHFSSRGLTDRNATLWAGFVLQGAGGPVYFAGDTGMGPHFQQIKERFGPMRLALLPVGAYLPRWFMAPVHMSPEDAVLAHQVLRAHRSVPIHYGTFELADDAQDQPLEDLRRALAAAHEDPARFAPLAFGHGESVTPLDLEQAVANTP